MTHDIGGLPEKRDLTATAEPKGEAAFNLGSDAEQTLQGKHGWLIPSCLFSRLALEVVDGGPAPAKTTK
ncbi:MAG TPA: hypothetical protein VH023_15185 [Rhodopila sp.]|nr:hypothetical protein [Rhodopila sp.]